MYNEKEFHTYFIMIKVACLNEITLPLLQTENPIDPVTAFIAETQAVTARIQLLPNDSAPTPAQVRADPLTRGPAFIKLLQQHKLSTPDARAQLSKEWGAWVAGEIHIYRVIAKSLVNHGWLLSMVKFGAGLALLKFLEDENTKTTDELLESWDEFSIQKGESLSKYRARLQNLVKQLAISQPPQPKSSGEQLRAYVHGLRQSEMYKGPLAQFERTGCPSVDKAHVFFKVAERNMAKESRQHHTRPAKVAAGEGHPSPSPLPPHPTPAPPTPHPSPSPLPPPQVSGDGPSYIVLCRHGQRLDRFLESTGEQW